MRGCFIGSLLTAVLFLLGGAACSAGAAYVMSQDSSRVTIQVGQPVRAHATAAPPLPLPDPPVTPEPTPTAVPPTPPAVPTATQATAVSPPVRIVIASVGLDARIIQYNISRTPPSDVGWWSERGLPGRGERIVLWGHNYGVFRPLEQVAGGELVELHTAEGVYTYRITDQMILQEIGVTLEQRYENGRLTMAPIGREQLVLITCWPFPAADSHRLALFAEPVGIERFNSEGGS